MTASNYYEVLGISKDASQEDVRRAYKRCALRYHPDKKQDDSDAAMFKKVSEAYQILGDPERRSTYDELMKEPSPEFWYIMNMFLNMMKQYIKTQKKQLVFNINVHLSEVYRGEIKKMVITTKKLEGTEVQKNIYISLKGIKSQYVFEGAGDETIDGSYQDIIVNVTVIADENIKRDTILDTLDLNIELPMTLYEYYDGFEKEIKHLDGEVLNVTVPPKNVRSSSCFSSCFSDYVVIHVMENKGLPDDDGKRGKLYIYFRLVLPEENPLDVLKNIT